MVTCSYCKKEGHHITDCKIIRCLTCKKIGHHHSKCKQRNKSLARCDCCGKPGHHILQCLRNQYQQHLREGKLLDFYKFIMSWKERRLLWIKDDNSLFGILPLDIIRKIDDEILAFHPFHDLIEMSKTISGSGFGGYGSKLTVINRTFFDIPKEVLEDTFYLYLGPDQSIIFVMSGHIQFTPKQLSVLSKYKLSHKHIYNYPSGN